MNLKFLIICLATLPGILLTALRAAEPRVAILGDSITYGGRWATTVESALRATPAFADASIVNFGLASETVSGLSEPGHAGGKFPRPDLHERLARVLDAFKPTHVLACYGMNDGIYLPLDGSRQKAFQDGMTRLKTEVENRGAKLVVITSPLFDGDHPAATPEGYDTVLDAQASWLLAQKGWQVIDIRPDLRNAVAEAKRTDPQFIYASDKVHPGQQGHDFIAASVVRQLWPLWQLPGKPAVAADEAMLVLGKRGEILKHAWLKKTGHKRPGVPGALPLADAEAQAVKRAVSKPPNIVFIITDDQGYGDISAHGNPILKTPHLDRLRSESVRFEDFHVSPTCAPTRSALFTGRHEFKNGVTHTILERERLAPGAVTLAQTLRDSGYATGIFGKWHLGDETEYLPSARGFTEMFIHGAGGIGQSYPGSCGDSPGNTYFNPAIFHNGRFVKTKGYCTDVFFRQASRWMRSQNQAEKPFFAYISTNAPHSPYIAKPEDAALYEGKVPSTQLAHFYGMIHNIDENIGKLLAELKKWGIERETIVIFMNDNGTALGESVFNAGMRGKKGSAFLGGTRASSFWRWPGTWEPGETKAITAHVDFFPTLAQVTGATLSSDAKQQIEGRSLKPLLENPGADWPDRHWFTHQGRWPKNADPNLSKFKMAAVRNTRWAMVSETGKSEPSWRLFDLTEDYAQKNDVSASHPEVIKELSAAYDRWWGECLPLMVNEQAVGPKLNPFAVRYWEQFGGGPTEADFKRMDPDKAFERGEKPRRPKAKRTD